MHIKKNIKNIISNLYKEVNELYPTLLKYRRHLHANPELSGEEVSTKKYLLKCLKKMGIKINKENITSVGATSLLVRINPLKKVKAEKTTLVIRADMDALLLTEEVDTLFKSKKRGVMHACGHDFHMTIALGVISIVKKHLSELENPLIVVFEAAEETFGDATKIIPFLEKENCKCYALHVDPMLDLGKVRITSGPFYASSIMIDIELKGDAKHVAVMPNDDLITKCSAFVTDLDLSIKKEKFINKAILKFGKIAGGNVRNITPSGITLSGVIRYLEEEDKNSIVQILHTTLRKHFNDNYNINALNGYPVLINDVEMTEKLKKITDLLDIEAIDDGEVFLTTESFAYFSRKFPSCFYNLGVSKGENYPLHSPYFDPNEEALKIGVLIQTMLVLYQHLSN